MENLDWTSITTGVFSSLMASLIFVVVLFRVRPHLKISPQIAEDIHPETGETVFVIKIVNHSFLFKVYEVRCLIEVFERQPSHNGEDLRRTDDKVVLENDSIWVLSRFNYRHLSQYLNNEKKLTSRTDYAVQIGTKFNLRKVVKDKKQVRIQVFAKHPLSGFSKVMSENYGHESQIKKGSFCSGNCFLIKNLD